MQSRLSPGRVEMRVSKMAMLLSLLLISATLTSVHSSDVGAEYTPTMENLEHSRIFMGETIHLRCRVVGSSTWSFEWFRNAVRIGEGEELIISPADEIHSGNYSCMGSRPSKTNRLYTPLSPLQVITVDVGHVLLRVRETVVVGETLEASCLVRNNPRVFEVWLYRDNVLVSTRKDGILDLFVPNVTLAHQGTYNCRARWFLDGRATVSRSTATPVTVLDVVSDPVLVVDTNYPPNKMMLSCEFQLVKRDPPYEVQVYFYRDDKKLDGIARSAGNSRKEVLKKAGQYRCKARVPALNVVKWSPLTQYREPAEQLNQDLM